LIIRLDISFVRGILQVMAANILPKFARYICARQRLRPNDLRKLIVRFDRFHESRAWLSFGFGCACLPHKCSVFLNVRGSKPQSYRVITATLKFAVWIGVFLLPWLYLSTQAAEPLSF